MAVIKCCGCGGSFVAVAFGVQRYEPGIEPSALANCPACRSTNGYPLPALVVTPKGIVAVGKKGPAFGLSKFEIKALVAA